MDAEKIAGIEALGRDRAESITAGSLVISTLMNRLKFDEVVVSTHGLRDGVLCEYLRDPARYWRGMIDEARANELARRSGSGGSPGTEVFSDALASRGIVTPRERLDTRRGDRGFPGPLPLHQGGEPLLLDSERGQLPGPQGPGRARPRVGQGQGAQDRRTGSTSATSPS